MPYRSDREALRERVETLERALSLAAERLDERDRALSDLRRRLRAAEARARWTRWGRAAVGAGSGTFAGLALTAPVGALTGGGLGLLLFGALVGGLFGALMGMGSEISPGG